jgi:Core-2/I-Branching enzyme
MNLAYVIIAHQQPQQLKRLITALQSDTASFFIHFNKKTESAYQEAVELLKDVPNVYFVPRRRIFWGHPSLVKAALSGLQAVSKSGVRYDYVSLLSAQDYPIKSIQEIERFFEQNAGKQFIDCDSLDGNGSRFSGNPPWDATSRIESWYFMWNSKIFRLPIRRHKLPYGYTPYLGYLWWSFSREFVEYMLEFLEQHPRYIQFFDHVFISDEFFFQTLLMNSPFKQAAVNDDLRFADWENPNPGIPATLLEADFERLQNTHHLFARKFDAARDSAILDLIDEKLLNLNPAKKFIVQKS